MTNKYDPQASREAAKQVICELIEAAGGALRGKIRLNKAFYYAHIYLWRDTGTPLTDYPIVRLPHGPAINDCADLLLELVQEGKLHISTTPCGPWDEYVYTLTAAADIPENREPNRVLAIRRAIEFVAEKTAAELSAITHEHSRSWQQVRDGQEMNIYTDLVEDEELRRIREQVRAVAEREGSIWAPAF